MVSLSLISSFSFRLSHFSLTSSLPSQLPLQLFAIYVYIFFGTIAFEIFCFCATVYLYVKMFPLFQLINCLNTIMLLGLNFFLKFILLVESWRKLHKLGYRISFEEINYEIRNSNHGIYLLFLFVFFFPLVVIDEFFHAEKTRSFVCNDIAIGTSQRNRLLFS